MQFVVLLQIRECGVGFAAHITNMFTYIQMAIHVIRITVALVEGLVTDGTMKVRLIEVSASVCVVKGPSFEGFATEVADIGALA